MCSVENFKMDLSSSINLIDRASIAVIASLWNQDYIIADIQNLFRNHSCKCWEDIENNILSSLRKVELPYELKLNLENYIQPMGMQILKWISLTQHIYLADPNFSKPIMFVWTERGMLDYTKTAKLILNRSSDKISCFCLACTFCIEDIILKLWPDVGHILSERIKENPLSLGAMPVTYWIYYLNGEVEKLMTLTGYCGNRNPYEFAFSLTFKLEEKCISSLNYFLQKIQPEKRPRLILLEMLCILYGPHGNVLLFLFSHLKESDVSDIIKETPYGVLASLLEWPCQEFFMAVANLSWNHLSKADYLNLFQDIVECCISRYSIGNIYKNLIKQFWQFTPPSFKEYVISKCISGTFLSRLLQNKNTNDIIRMIFNDCSPNERQQMVFYFEGMNMCDLLVKKERWESLKLLIKNCISSQTVLNEFIEQYQNYRPYYYNKETEMRRDILFTKIREWY